MKQALTVSKYIILLILILISIKPSSTFSQENNLTTLYGIGDSITYGHTNCRQPDECPRLEENTYLYLIAQHLKNQYPSLENYINLSSSGTTASHKKNYNITILNSFINPTAHLPENQTQINHEINQRVNNLSGEESAAAGEYNLILDHPNQSLVLVALGRNDTRISPIKRSDYKSGLENIVNLLPVKPNITLSTVQPMNIQGWQMWTPESVRRQEYNDYIISQSYPVEIDTFFSSAVWELAHNQGTRIMPVNEYFLNHYDQNYLSVDFIHPEKQGHAILADIYINHADFVTNQTLNHIPTGSDFVITSQSHGFGQIVSFQGSEFRSSTGFEVYPHQPFYYTKHTQNTQIYSTTQLATSPVYDSNLSHTRRAFYRQEKLHFFISQPQSLINPSLYISSISSDLCQSSSWTLIDGSINESKYFISDHTPEDLGISPGKYVVAINHQSPSGSIITGNPASCNHPHLIQDLRLWTSIGIEAQPPNNHRQLAADIYPPYNPDHTINSKDYQLLLRQFNTHQSSADVNKDGLINIFDLNLLVSNFGQSSSPIPTPTSIPPSPPPFPNGCNQTCTSNTDCENHNSDYTCSAQYYPLAPFENLTDTLPGSGTITAYAGYVKPDNSSIGSYLTRGGHVWYAGTDNNWTFENLTDSEPNPFTGVGSGTITCYIPLTNQQNQVEAYLTRGGEIWHHGEHSNWSFTNVTQNVANIGSGTIHCYSPFINADNYLEAYLTRGNKVWHQHEYQDWGFFDTTNLFNLVGSGTIHNVSTYINPSGDKTSYIARSNQLFRQVLQHTENKCRLIQNPKSTFCQP